MRSQAHSPAPAQSSAIVIGCNGGIGQALLTALQQAGQHTHVTGLSRHSTPSMDITDESTIARAAAVLADTTPPPNLIINAAGFLHGHGFMPEKSLRQLDPAHMAHAFAINAIGPALLMKHLLPLFPRNGRAVFATLSARVGSIGDNRLGGWHSYRASKAALNQFVRCAAIELARTRPQAICIALHPGTVDTSLSTPFAKTGLKVRPPAEAADELLRVIDGLTPDDNGEFFDYRGERVLW